MPKRQHRRSHRTTTGNTYRFFVHPDAIRGRDVLIEDQVLIHQLGNVLRLDAGMSITLLDNSGWEYTVTLEHVERHAISGVVAGRQLALAEPRLKLTLYVAVLKGERFEWLLQKCTELGIAAFVPVVCERSVIDDAADIGTAKIERWERIVREAAEQSRRGKLPKIQPVQLFAPACEHAVRRSKTLILWEGNDGITLRHALSASVEDAEAPLSLALFSGPEGGWTAGEIETAIRYNIALVTLGPRILRAETAPLAAVAAIMYAVGDLD